MEVLRGPFTALYGSSSCCVISLFSSAPTERRVSPDVDAGRARLQQQPRTLASPLDGGLSVRTQVSRLRIEGFRPQSSAERTPGNLRLGWEQDTDRAVLGMDFSA